MLCNKYLFLSINRDIQWNKYKKGRNGKVEKKVDKYRRESWEDKKSRKYKWLKKLSKIWIEA